MTAATGPARELCPLCGKANQCAMETGRAGQAGEPPCWCTQVDFRPEVLKQIPLEARRKACICEACARQGAPESLDCGSGPQ